MYLDNNRITYYVSNVRIFEHKLNALLTHSLHDVFTKHIHHKNHCPLDNDPSNLIVVTHSEHRKIHNNERSEEELQRISEGLKGHPVSQKTRETLRKVHTGNTNAQKDYPTIIKNGKSPKGEQIYSIHYHGKIYVSTIRKELLEEAIETGEWKKDGFTLKGKSERGYIKHPRIVKVHIKNKLYYRVTYRDKILKTSIHKHKMVEFIKSEEWKDKYESLCK